MEYQLPDAAFPARAAAREHPSFVLSFPNTFGCGVGRRTVGGRETDEWCLVVFVSRKLPREALRTEEIIPHELRTSDGVVITDVVERPEPRFGADSNQYRPLQGGCEIGAANGSGTLGGILYDSTDDQPVLLTCNHVLTLTGQRASIPANDVVTQPASSMISIGNTKRIVPWFLTPLGADYAVLEARVDAGIVSPDVNVGLQFRVINLGRHPYVPIAPFQGLEVLKRGATTETTAGTVKDVSTTVVIRDFDGRRVRIGGVDSVFSVQAQPGDVFFSSGDSGSLVVDSDRGAVRGMLFAGDMAPGAITYGNDILAIMQALQLDTACTGGLNAMIRRAIFKRRVTAMTSVSVEGAFTSSGVVTELKRNVDKFRHKYIRNEPDGTFSGAFGTMLELLAADLAEELHSNDDFAGLMDAAFGDWLISPTLYDLLEYRLPDDFDRRVHAAFDCICRCRPEVTPDLRWFAAAFAESGGLRMRDLLCREVAGAPASKTAQFA